MADLIPESKVSQEESASGLCWSMEFQKQVHVSEEPTLSIAADQTQVRILAAPNGVTRQRFGTLPSALYQIRFQRE